MEDRQMEEAIADLNRAVYSRLGSPRKFGEEVQRRAAASQAVFEASQDPSGKPPQFTDDFVRHWVAADVTAFRRISGEERQRVAADIAVSMKHPAYAQKLKSIDPRLARRANEAAMLADSPAGVASIKNPPPRGEGLLLRAPIEPEKLPGLSVDRPKPVQTHSQSVNGFLGVVPAPAATAKRAQLVKPLDPQGDIQQLLTAVTYETQGDGTVKYSVRAKPSFVDHGNQILMIGNANKDNEAILAGLLLASEKYGGAFEITGSEEFKQRAIEIMVKYQLNAKLKNPAQDTVFRELSKQAKAEVSDPSTAAGTPPGPKGRGAPAAAPAGRDVTTAPLETARTAAHEPL